MQTRREHHHVYMLINEEGAIYIGATSRLMQRALDHNGQGMSAKRRTKGHRWHLLAYIKLPTREEAFATERFLHHNPGQKYAWRDYCAPRARTLAQRHGHKFPWLQRTINPRDLPAALHGKQHRP